MLKMQLGFLARLRPVAPYLQPRAHLHGSMASSLSASVPFDRAMPRLLPTPLTMPRLLPTPSTVITVSSPFSSLVTCPWATPCQTELVCPPITTLAKHTRLPCWAELAHPFVNHDPSGPHKYHAMSSWTSLQIWVGLSAPHDPRSNTHAFHVL